MKILNHILFIVIPCAVAIACNGGNFGGPDNTFSNRSNRTVGPDDGLPPGQSNLTDGPSLANGTCSKSFHVALVLDSSGSMKHEPNATDNSGDNGPNSKLNQVRNAASVFLNSLGSEDYIGVATFNNDAQILTNTTNDKATAINSMAGLVADGGTNVSAGLERGYDILLQANAYGLNGTNPDGSLLVRQPVLILLSDGKKTESSNPIDIANQIKTNIPNVKIITIGYDLSPEAAGIMTAIASAPSLYLYNKPGETIYETFLGLTQNLCQF